MTPEEKKEKNKLYYQENKDKHKEYYQENKEQIKERRRRYYQENKDKHKEYYQENKDKHKEYYQENKEQIKERVKNYQQKNTNKINLYRKIKLETDPLFKLKHNLRKSVSKGLKKINNKKQSKTELILGCSFVEFRKHLESKFEPWMNWDNYGSPKDEIFEPNKTWDIDHIIPQSKGNTYDEIIKLNHYTNLQPLCSHFNRFVKRNTENQ